MKIEAKIIADSIWNGKRITTMQLVMPRFILAQFNKHRAFSNNAASSRAVPTARIIEQVMEHPVIPTYWGKNQAGMVAEAELTGEDKRLAEEAWLAARDAAVREAKLMAERGVHKQIVNRLLEPFTWAHVVVTSTEWDNFFRLRLEHDSQPEMQELARCMKSAMDESTPTHRQAHLPYIRADEIESWVNLQTGMFELLNMFKYFAPISAARCARVSYLNHDGSNPDIQRDLDLAQRLQDARHSVCFEHQAWGCINPNHASGNFLGWAQYRKHLDI